MTRRALRHADPGVLMLLVIALSVCVGFALGFYAGRFPA